MSLLFIKELILLQGLILRLLTENKRKESKTDFKYDETKVPLIKHEGSLELLSAVRTFLLSPIQLWLQTRDRRGGALTLSHLTSPSAVLLGRRKQILSPRLAASVSLPAGGGRWIGQGDLSRLCLPGPPTLMPPFLTLLLFCRSPGEDVRGAFSSFPGVRLPAARCRVAWV